MIYGMYSILYALRYWEAGESQQNHKIRTCVCENTGDHGANSFLAKQNGSGSSEGECSISNGNTSIFGQELEGNRDLAFVVTICFLFCPVLFCILDNVTYYNSCYRVCTQNSKQLFLVFLSNIILQYHIFLYCSKPWRMPKLVSRGV